MLSKKKIISLFFDNWPAKTLSVASALVLFIFHNISTLEERFLSVPLKIEGSQIMMPLDPSPQTVRITLRGVGSEIRAVSESDIEAYIDIGSVNEKTTRRFPVLVRKSEAAKEIGTFEIAVSPRDITLMLDERKVKFVKVNPVMRGEPAAGFEIASLSINPERVRLEGPAELMDDIDELKTEEIDTEGRSAAFSVAARLVNPMPPVLTVGSASVEVRLDINPISAFHVINDAEVRPLNLSQRFSFSAEPLTLNMEWNEAELGGFPTAKIDFFVDCANLNKEGVYELPVQVEMPDGAKLLSATGEAEPVAQVTLRLK